uniref:Glutaredoxin domain-containing protein n=1 Tax=Aplanochytrium stocchinoi TaxID=215587 RepID=A0A7S3LQV8_9STRA
MEMSRNLARFEGILTGTSGGGTVSAALELAQTAPPGTNVLAILADTAERYLSTPLFDRIEADMTSEEIAISASTPDTPPPPIDLPAVSEDALAFVQNQNSKNKVLVWSLEYCEFCWTIFRLFDAAGVPYRAINVDSFEYAKDNMGNKYRSALQSITDCNTFPQCFIDGAFFGGAADAVMKWKSGELQEILIAAGINDEKFDCLEVDPFEFLPKWMSANPLRSK